MIKNQLTGLLLARAKECAVNVPYASIRYALNRAFSLLLKSASVRAYSGDK